MSRYTFSRHSRGTAFVPRCLHVYDNSRWPLASHAASTWTTTEQQSHEESLTHRRWYSCSNKSCLPRYNLRSRKKNTPVIVRDQETQADLSDEDREALFAELPFHWVSSPESDAEVEVHLSPSSSYTYPVPSSSHVRRFDSTALLLQSPRAIATYRHQSRLHGWEINSTGLSSKRRKRRDAIDEIEHEESTSKHILSSGPIMITETETEKRDEGGTYRVFIIMFTIKLWKVWTQESIHK